MKNMKKTLLCGLLLGCCLLLCACGEGGEKGADTAKKTEQKTASVQTINLSALSESMRYAQAYNMISLSPEDYVGARVRVKGPHTIFFYDATKKNYHYITVSDSTACCALDMEFRLASGQSYPERNEEVEVEGTFQSYEELGTTYYYLADAVIQ